MHYKVNFKKHPLDQYLTWILKRWRIKDLGSHMKEKHLEQCQPGFSRDNTQSAFGPKAIRSVLIILSSYFHRKVKGRIFENSTVINACYREKVIYQTTNHCKLLNSVFFCFKSHLQNAVLSHLQHLKQTGKDNNIFFKSD